MSFLFEFLVRLAGLLQPLIIASFHLLVFFTGKYSGVVWCVVVLMWVCLRQTLKPEHSLHLFVRNNWNIKSDDKSLSLSLSLSLSERDNSLF